MQSEVANHYMMIETRRISRSTEEYSTTGLSNPIVFVLQVFEHGEGHLALLRRMGANGIM
jgi:hypothetical protein